MNVLFTNAGRRTYLLEYALKIKEEGLNLKLFVCDTSINVASMHVSEEIQKIITPFVSGNEEEYLSSIIEICKQYEIEVIVPLMDFELPVLSRNKSLFTKQNIKLWVSDYEFVMNCLDKKRNYNFCLEHNIPTPNSYFNLKSLQFPVVKKKIYGSGSVGLEIFENEPIHMDFMEDIDMFQDFIVGREIGMDIFNDINGNYVHSCCREKLLMRSGETDKATSFKSEKFELMAQFISEKTKHIGNLDLDLIETKNGEIYFIDFNPRFGGGYPFTHNSGANYLKYLLEESGGLQPEVPQFKKCITGMKGLNLYFYEQK